MIKLTNEEIVFSTLYALHNTKFRSQSLLSDVYYVYKREALKEYSAISSKNDYKEIINFLTTSSDFSYDKYNDEFKFNAGSNAIDSWVEKNIKSPLFDTLLKLRIISEKVEAISPKPLEKNYMEQ